ncbi:hypothetical protein [Herbiconiux sp. YIM B11900]|uniref:hypothetical protein n=1 Tax=Herbiconiux sp. YIM B11900 TaxID=3404131 RepID=UPI003F84BB5C
MSDEAMLHARRRRPRRLRRSLLFITAVLIVGIGLAMFLMSLTDNQRTAPAALPESSTASADPGIEAVPSPVSTRQTMPDEKFDRGANSLTDPISPWLIVNKTRPIADATQFVPPDLTAISGDIPNPKGHTLRSEAATALVGLVAAARAETGVRLVA